MRVQDGLCVLGALYLVCEKLLRTLRVVILALFYYCLLDLTCGECNVISLYVLCSIVNVLCVACLTVFVNCLVKQFAICLLLWVWL